MAQSGVKLPEHIRNAIIAGRVAGISPPQLAKLYNCNVVTVHRLTKEVKRAVQETSRDWRMEQAELAVKSVNRGLRDSKDPYKSAAIGVQALKGLGVYQQDATVQFNIGQRLEHLPTKAQDLLDAIPIEPETQD